VVRVNHLWMRFLSPSTLTDRYRSTFFMHRPSRLDQCLAQPRSGRRGGIAIPRPPTGSSSSSSSSASSSWSSSLGPFAAEERRNPASWRRSPPRRRRKEEEEEEAEEKARARGRRLSFVDPTVIAKREREWREWFVEEAALYRVLPTLLIPSSITAACCRLLPSDDEQEAYDAMDDEGEAREGRKAKREPEEGMAAMKDDDGGERGREGERGKRARSLLPHRSSFSSSSTWRQQRAVENLSLAMHLLDGGVGVPIQQTNGEAARGSASSSLSLPEPCERTLFVCKLNPLTTSEGLARCFDASFGPVLSCTILKDPETGASLCYGFLEFGSVENCYLASEKMNRALIDDYRIVTEFSMSVKKSVRPYAPASSTMPPHGTAFSPSAPHGKNKDYFENDSPAAQAVRAKWLESSCRKT